MTKEKLEEAKKLQEEIDLVKDDVKMLRYFIDNVKNSNNEEYKVTVEDRRENNSPSIQYPINKTVALNIAQAHFDEATDKLNRLNKKFEEL